MLNSSDRHIKVCAVDTVVSKEMLMLILRAQTFNIMTAKCITTTYTSSLWQLGSNFWSHQLWWHHAHQMCLARQVTVESRRSINCKEIYKTFMISWMQSVSCPLKLIFSILPDELGECHLIIGKLGAKHNANKLQRGLKIAVVKCFSFYLINTLFNFNVQMFSGWRENGVREDGDRSGHSPLRLPVAGLPAQRPTAGRSARGSGAVPVSHVGRPGRPWPVWGRHRDWLERSVLGPDQSQGQTERPQPSLWWDRRA